MRMGLWPSIIRICPDCRINVGMTIGHYYLHGRIAPGAVACIIRKHADRDMLEFHPQ